MVSWQIVKVGKRTIRPDDYSTEVVLALRSEAGGVLEPGQTLRLVPRTIPASCPLTASELGVLGSLANGLTYKQIAQKRDRAIPTIRSQLHTIYGKLGVHD